LILLQAEKCKFFLRKNTQMFLLLSQGEICPIPTIYQTLIY